MAVANVQQPPVAPAVADVRPVVPEARSNSSLSIKVWRAASVIFEALAMTGFIVVMAAVLTSSVSVLHTFTALVLSRLARNAHSMREKLHDFEDPQELAKLRASAPHMSYTELKRQFNWADLKQYNLLPIDGENGLRHKVLLHLATPENFKDMQGFFWGSREVESLLEHGIIELDIAQAIRGGNQARIQQLLEPQDI